MIVFLALSTLGLGFYVALLVALYRDSRQRRRDRLELYRELEVDRASVFAFTRQNTELTTGGPPKLSDEVLWLPVTRVHWNPMGGVPQHNNRNLRHSPSST